MSHVRPHLFVLPGAAAAAPGLGAAVFGASLGSIADENPRTRHFAVGSTRRCATRTAVTGEGVDAAAPTPSSAAEINRSSGPDGTLRSGGDPESARLARVLGDREARDADQEDGAGACGRDARNHAREAGVSVAVDRDVGRVERRPGLGAGIADTRPGDRLTRTRLATESLPDDHEPVHFEVRFSRVEVHTCMAVSSGPGKRCTFDLAD